jgi:hypothetical protein
VAQCPVHLQQLDYRRLLFLWHNFRTSVLGLRA